MQTRPIGRPAIRAAAACLVTCVIVTAGIDAAAVADPGDSGWSEVDAASLSTSQTKAEIKRLVGRIAKLEKVAAKTSKRAQIADERYVVAKRAAAEAARRLAVKQVAADDAGRQAKQSSGRAAVVAAQLARAGRSNSAAGIVLEGGGAAKVLWGLSRVSQLTVESGRIARDAEHDSARADDARSEATTASRSLAERSEDAQRARDDAKHEAEKASAVVRTQQTRLTRLNAQLAQLGGAPVAVDSAVLPSDGSIAGRAIAFARAQIGEPYVFAAAGPSSWDCSGLTMGAYAAVGRNIGGHGATVQYTTARDEGKLVPYSQVQPGDLLFYGDGDMYHVTLYSGNGMMIEAPYEGRDVREVPVRTDDLFGSVARFSG